MHCWKEGNFLLTLSIAYFSFRVGLLLSTFSSFKRTPKITQILMLYQAIATTLIICKHAPKLIIFGKHNLQTFKHNTLINELLLMQIY